MEKRPDLSKILILAPPVEREQPLRLEQPPLVVGQWRPVVVAAVAGSPHSLLLRWS